MLGRNHFAESSWHVLTFFHPKFDVRCTNGNYFLNSFDTLPGFQTQEEPNNWSSTLIKRNSSQKLGSSRNGMGPSGSGRFRKWKVLFRFMSGKVHLYFGGNSVRPVD
jgi:hypothetical protein